MKFSDKTNKSQNVTEDRLHSFLLTSFLCIMAAIIVLCGATFAWFQSAKIGMSEPIISANYDVLSSIQDVAGENNSYTISGDKEYTVTVGATGNASTGFFILTVSYTDTSNTLHTNTYISCQLAPGGLVTFKLKSAYAAVVTISAQWGTSSKSENPDINGNTLITVGEAEGNSGNTESGTTTPVTTTTAAPAATTTATPAATTTAAPVATTTTAPAATTTTAPAATTTTTSAVTTVGE